MSIHETHAEHGAHDRHDGHGAQGDGLAEPALYGLVAQFEDADRLLAAAHRAREEGYRRMDAYSPMPIHGLDEAIGFKDNRLPWMIFFGGIAGAAIGYGLQAWVQAVDLPLNIGGRPMDGLGGWVNYIPITFECTVLLAAFAAVFGMLGLNGFPKPYHPIFNAPGFERATQDRFFLCIEADDPRFDLEETRAFLERLGPEAVTEAER